MHLPGTISLIFIAYLMGLRVAGVDLRKVGSQNIGATNVARNLGLQWGLVVLVLDMGKGALPVLVATNIWPTEAEGNAIRIALVALAAFFGHLCSIFLSFRGGKGVATAFGISLVLLPKAALPAAAAFLLVTWLWRYVSLASLTASLILILGTMLAHYGPVYIGLSFVFALLIVIRHHSNIRALLQGKERKI